MRELESEINRLEEELKETRLTLVRRLLRSHYKLFSKETPLRVARLVSNEFNDGEPQYPKCYSYYKGITLEYPFPIRHWLLDPNFSEEEVVISGTEEEDENFGPDHPIYEEISRVQSFVKVIEAVRVLYDIVEDEQEIKIYFDEYGNLKTSIHEQRLWAAWQ